MIIQYPNYERSILNISQSILKAYGLEVKYATIQEIDSVLKTKPKHVMFILLDGLGTNILEQNLPSSAALRKQQITKLTSIFPPTTVAATTAFLSGQLPRTNGHISWMQYDKETDINTVIFRNEDYCLIKIERQTKKKIPSLVLKDGIFVLENRNFTSPSHT